jgi:hypothetical protein
MYEIVKHLDTLVGSRSPHHQKLYDFILQFPAMDLKADDVIDEYPYHMCVGALADTADFNGNVTRNELCYIITNVETKVQLYIFKSNISTNISREGKGLVDLDDKCRMLIRSKGISEPWTVE